MKSLREASKAKKVSPVITVGEVIVNGLLSLPYCADSGATSSYISRQALEELTELGAKISVEPLEQETEVTVAGGAVILCHDAAKLDLRLQTVAGPVHLSDVNCIVLEGDEEEFILGNDMLVSLGIDVNEQLSQLASGTFVEDHDPFEIAEPRQDQSTDVRQHLEAMVVAAGDSGFDSDFLPRLRALVMEFEDVFRIELGNDPPADVEPLRVTIQEGAKPFRTCPRRYAPAQSDFLRAHTKQLLEMGFIRRNQQSHWACAAVPVPKAGRPSEFRLTIDYRPVNAVTVPIAGTSPDLVAKAQNLHGVYGFANFDMTNGFTQLPLHPDSQEIMSFVTDDAVFTPTRVPQGATDSALHFQSQMQLVFQEMLYKRLLVWIDDLLVYERSPAAFIAALRQFFVVVRKTRLKLSVLKSCLFKKVTKWCGRLFSGVGIRHDPARVSALRELPLPVTAADLQQFLCAAGWLRESIMDFSRTMQPLHKMLEAALKQVGRTKRLAAGFTLTWTNESQGAFETARKLLATSQLLHYADDNADVCVFTDASERGWGLVVSQVREWKDNDPVEKQQHELLLCKSGVFDETERRWSIIEKEAFPIIFAARNLSHLLVRSRGFRLFCDHKNLVFVFAPDKEVKRHVRGKLQRWAMSLTGLSFQVEHIDGVNNLWADLLSRWGLPLSEEVGVEVQCKYITRSRARELAEAVSADADRDDEPLANADGDDAASDNDEATVSQEEHGNGQKLQLRMKSGDFVFPTLREIKTAQVQHIETAPDIIEYDEDGIALVDGRIWLPVDAIDLVQRILVVSHCGVQGHRGLDPMVQTIGEVFWISNLMTLCRRFLSRCLLCKHVKGGNIIARPWGPTYNASEANELLHWDFLTMGDSTSDCKYVLALKDGLTHYCELIACDSASSTVAAAALVDWWKRFGTPRLLISDQGSHFKNDVVSQVCKLLEIEQELVLVYAPWINGTVERLNRDILQVVRVLLMELQLDTREWVYVLPLVQGNLNHTPVTSLGNRTPAELFTGLRRSTPFEPIVIERLGKPVVVTDNVSIPADKFERLRTSLAAMHREVVDRREQRRLQNMQRSKGTPCNFSVGDFVLWSRIDKRLSTNKLLARWIGPFEVIEDRPHSFVIRHLITKQQFDVHGSRLKYYSDSNLDVNEELLAHIGNQGMVLGVETLKRHRKEHGVWQVLVSWVGLQDEEDSWELLRDMTNQVPAKVAQYVLETEDEAFKAAYKRVLARQETD